MGRRVPKATGRGCGRQVCQVRGRGPVTEKQRPEVSTAAGRSCTPARRPARCAERRGERSASGALAPVLLVRPGPCRGGFRRSQHAAGRRVSTAACVVRRASRQRSVRCGPVAVPGGGDPDDMVQPWQVRTTVGQAVDRHDCPAGAGWPHSIDRRGRRRRRPAGEENENRGAEQQQRRDPRPRGVKAAAGRVRVTANSCTLAAERVQA